MAVYVKTDFKAEPHPIEDYMVTRCPDGSVRYSRRLSVDEEVRFWQACARARDEIKERV